MKLVNQLIQSFLTDDLKDVQHQIESLESDQFHLRSFFNRTFCEENMIDSKFFKELLFETPLRRASKLAFTICEKIQTLPETEPNHLAIELAQPVEEIFESLPEFTMDAMCDETNVMPKDAVPLQVEVSAEPIKDNDTDAIALAALIAAR